MTSSSLGHPFSWRVGRLPTGRVIPWLAFAAAPTFAAMALVTATQPAGMPAMCPAMPDPSWLTGMAPMYVLMSLFHVTPWLKLLAHRRRRVDVDTRPTYRRRAPGSRTPAANQV
jgi:hypothetical protein